jgi:hypothetical protein
MEETFFEMLERTRAVDHCLFWLAVLTPLLIAGLAAVLRNKPALTRNRHRWVLACLTMPGLLVLWRVYNAICDRFGLDSILGLGVNVCVFAAAAMLATGLRLVLRTMLMNSPAVQATKPAAAIKPAPEFRPYKPSLAPAEAPTGYSARLSETEPRGSDFVTESIEPPVAPAPDNVET